MAKSDSEVSICFPGESRWELWRLNSGRFVLADTAELAEDGTVEPFKSLFSSEMYKNIAHRIIGRVVSDDTLAHISRLATAAKCMGSETGVRISGEVARIMGPDAMDPRWPVEKAFRDAKLTMIYEGTNQANMITHFKDVVRTLRRY